MRSRVEGQIWIDRNSPNRLKYFVNGEEYEVNVAQNYRGQEGIVKGTVVKLEKKNIGGTLYDTLCKATFPEDLEKVIGVAGQTFVDDETEGESILDRTMLPVMQTDSLIFDKTEINNAFVDMDEALADWASDNTKGIGAPIYWFIGRTRKSGDTYTHTDSTETNYAGKLTFNTPSGYQWKKTSLDSEFNIGYDNLPIVGRVSAYTIENGEFTYLKINVNYYGFERNLGWSYPYFGNGLEEIKDLSWKGSTIKGVSIDIRHGLFANSTLIRPRCFCQVLTLEKDNDTEYQTSVIVDNFYGLDDEETASPTKYTHIEAHTETQYRYNIHGNIIYKFDKQEGRN